MTTDFELREWAEELFIDGTPVEQIAETVGVSVRTVNNWSAQDGWVDKRNEHRAAIRNIKHNTVRLRKRLIEKAVNSLDPQDIYAAVRLETVALREDRQDEKAADIDRPKLFLEDMEFIAGVLQDVDPEGLKVFGRNFDLIVNRFKEQYAQAS